MEQRAKRLSIVIPAYNEEKRIGNTLESYGSFFSEIKAKDYFNFEILVVLNGCKDNTLEVVKAFNKKFREIVYLNFKQAGKGFAITEGFKDSLKRDNEFIGFVDADMSTTPEEFYKLFKELQNKEYLGGVIASRWLKNSRIKTPQTFLRKITSRGFNFIVKAILFVPYSDTQCGAKVFRNTALKKIIKNIGISEWAYDVELLYHLKKERVKINEVPTVWEDQRGSKLNLVKVPFQMFASVIRLRLVYSPLKDIVRLYNKLPEDKKIHNW